MRYGRDERLREGRGERLREAGDERLRAAAAAQSVSPHLERAESYATRRLRLKWSLQHLRVLGVLLYGLSEGVSGSG